MSRQTGLWIIAGFLAVCCGGCGGGSEGGDTDVVQETNETPPGDVLEDATLDTVEGEVLSDQPPDVQADEAPVSDLAAEDALEEEAASTCEPARARVPGEHNAGSDCLSCHASMGGSRKFTVAGTLYSSAAGGTAVSGATIVVRDSASKVVKLATANNGNFYTTESFTFPLTVAASKCPDHQPMGGSVSNGSCNASACHGNSSFRIHLP